MKWKVLAAAAVLLMSGDAFAITPRIFFVRRVPAAHDLAPAERVAVVYAIGDSEMVKNFVEDYVYAIARSGSFRVVENAVEDNHHSAFSEVRERHPADIYIAVKRFTCASSERSAEGSEHEASGERVRRIHQWVDVTCLARLEVLDSGGKRLFVYSAKGEGTSPRSTALSDDERAVGYEQGAHYAAITAADVITPRNVRESIDLDETAPAFDEAYAMVTLERLADARAIWEAALAQHHDSAALHYDLGAVCEAAGDLQSARDHLEAAVRLVPSDRRYVRELDLFRQRNPVKRVP